MINSIKITSGAGTAPTEIAAFDAALRQARIPNYNLITLSSVIPEGTTVRMLADNEAIEGRWGERLYVVIAEERLTTPNVEAWAGIGWAQEPATGRGLLVEQHGGSEASARKNIEDSLRSMFGGRNMDIGEINMEVKGIVCEREPVCALVAAVFETAAW